LRCAYQNNPEVYVRVNKGVLLILVFGVGAALAIAVPAAYDSNDSSGDSDISQSNRVSQNAASLNDRAGSAELPLDLTTIKRTIPKNIQNSHLFQSKTWFKPPPPPPSLAANTNPVPVPPPEPTAPPIPFAFVGRMIDGNVVTLFLEKNGQHFAVKLNDIVDGNYQLVKISENDADFSYLPMKVTQQLVFDSTLVSRSASEVDANPQIRSIKIRPLIAMLPSQAMPSQSMTPQAIPTQAMPIQAAPSQAMPSQSEPPQSTPSQSEPSQSTPPQPISSMQEQSETAQLDAVEPIEPSDQNP
jgi:hypothetical protein